MAKKIWYPLWMTPIRCNYTTSCLKTKILLHITFETFIISRFSNNYFPFFLFCFPITHMLYTTDHMAPSVLAYEGNIDTLQEKKNQKYSGWLTEKFTLLRTKRKYFTLKYCTTLEFLIIVGPTIIIFSDFSRAYSLIWMPTFIDFWHFSNVYNCIYLLWKFYAAKIE